MPWGYAAAAAGSYLASSSKGGGGGGTTTNTKEPWAPAAPWLQANLGTGQNLQNYYQQNPFNALQQGAYQNLFAGNDYINQMVPGMLSQVSQPQGFDRSNPRARPMPMQFPTMQPMGQPGGMRPMQGLLGANMNQTQNPFANGLLPAQPQPAAAPAAPASDYFGDFGSAGA